MTTIRDLSEEALQMIFAKLPADDVFECQYVFRHWYTSAHVNFLEDVNLSSNEKIDSFIKSIDYNPKPLYLNAVKFITITGDEPDDQGSNTVFDKEKFGKLFFRFPNLLEIELEDVPSILFSLQRRKYARYFWKNAPNFVISKVRFSTADLAKANNYTNLMYKVRLLASEVDTILLDDVNRFGGVTKYLSDWLPIFKILPGLKEINTSTSIDDKIGFAEKYLATKSDQEYDEFVKSVSKIKELEWNSIYGSCLNGLKFISKYMTGLNKMCITAKLTSDWSSIGQRLYLDVALGLCRTVNESSLSIHTSSATAKEYLPTIITSALHRTAETSRRISGPSLALIMQKESDLTTKNGSVVINVECNRSKCSQNIRIEVKDKVTSAATFFKSEIGLDNVDNFQVVMEDKANVEISMGFYLEVLKCMPSLKTVSFDIPASVILSMAKIPARQQHFHVKQFTLRVASQASPQILELYRFMFPKLERLYLFYSCGVWKSNIGDFHLELGRYYLNQLHIDLTPARQTMKNSPRIWDNGYLVVEVSLMKGSKRYLFKVPVSDIRKTTVINDIDLQGFHEETTIIVFI